MNQTDGPGPMSKPSRIAVTWPCDVDRAHGQAGVRITPGLAVCGACAWAVRDAIYERKMAYAAAQLGLAPRGGGKGVR